MITYLLDQGNGMNLDERLEALIERHEALTQSCEILLADSLEHSKYLERDGEHIRALVRIAELHSQRWSG